MLTVLRLLGIASTFGLVAIADPLAEPLRVTSLVVPGPYYVGQAIEIKVDVEGASSALVVEPIRGDPATVRVLPGSPARPSQARFVMIPERAGPLDIPPFRARSGDRSSTSKLSRLTIANVPSLGRTSAFLGGVGAFQVLAEALPLSVQVGQTLEFHVKMTGPAAWGSVRSPDLNEWSVLPAGFRVETLPDIFEPTDPPVRTFRYRLRPLKAGEGILPPVRISAFEPTSGLFATRATSSVLIRIGEKPRFNPDRLDYQPAVERRSRLPMFLGIGLIVIAAGMTFWLRWSRKQKTKPIDPRAFAWKLFRGLDASDEGIEAARAVTEALTRFLEEVSGRAPGVLTPPEAREGIASVTGETDLANLAERLILRTDRVCYGGIREDATGLIDEGRELFRRIAEVLGSKKREREGPREAAKTARE